MEGLFLRSFEVQLTDFIFERLNLVVADLMFSELFFELLFHILKLLFLYSKQGVEIAVNLLNFSYLFFLYSFFFLELFE